MSPRIADGRRTAHSSGPKTRTIADRTQGKRIGVPEAGPIGVAERPRNWSVPPARRLRAPIAQRPSSAPKRSGWPRSTSRSRAPAASAIAKRMRPDASGSSERRPDVTAGEYTEARPASRRASRFILRDDGGPRTAPPQRHAHRPRRGGPPSGRARVGRLRGRAHRRRGLPPPTDRTEEIARAAGARVLVRPFDGFGRQKNAAAALASHRWILSHRRRRNRLAEARRRDPRVPRGDGFRGLASRGLPRARSASSSSGASSASGATRSCGPRASTTATRARFSDDPVHEKILATGRVESLQESVLHRSYRDLAHYLEKLDRYTTLAAEAKWAAGEGRRRFPAGARPLGVLRPRVPAPRLPRRLGRAHVRGPLVGEHAPEVPQAARARAGDRPR